MIVLPEYKDFFDREPVDNDWIGLPEGKADEKGKWVFGLAPSFSEHGIEGRINPSKNIEGYISLTSENSLRLSADGPYTLGDLSNIPDLRARWFFHNIFYLRPENIEDQHFIDAVFSCWDKEKKNESFESTTKQEFKMAKIDLTVPTAIQQNVSDFTVYVGGDSSSTDQKMKAYCKTRGLVNYELPQSVFLMLSLSYRTKSLEPSYMISEKNLNAIDKIAESIEERISKVLGSQFKRMTLERRNVYRDSQNSQ